MPWVRFDDGFPIHRKVALLSDAAYRLLTESICWSTRNLTDGFIGKDEVITIGPRARPRTINELVVRGNWHGPGHTCEACAQPITGWVIHDYLKYQPARNQVEEERRVKAERTRLWRERKAGRRPSGDASQDVPVTNHKTDTYVSRDAAPYPPRPAPKGGVGTTSLPAPPAAYGGGAPAGGEPKVICRTCGNATSSAYHRNTCLRSDVIAEGFR